VPTNQPTNQPTNVTDQPQCGAETLRGSYPVEVITTLARICKEAELVGA
jgi:pyruvate kinase